MKIQHIWACSMVGLRSWRLFFYKEVSYTQSNTVIQIAKSKYIQTASAINELFVEYVSNDDPLNCFACTRYPFLVLEPWFDEVLPL